MPTTLRAEVDRPGPPGRPSRARGRPRSASRPSVDRDEPVDDRHERLDDVLDPDDRHTLGLEPADGPDQDVDLVLGEAAGDLVEQQQARPRRRGRAPARAACGRAAAASRPDGWRRASRSGSSASAVDRSRSMPIARPRRRTSRPRGRSRRRSSRRTAAGSGTCARCPSRARSVGRHVGDVPAVEQDPAGVRARGCR